MFTQPLTCREIPRFGGKAPFAQIAVRIWGLVASPVSHHMLCDGLTIPVIRRTLGGDGGNQNLAALSPISAT